MITKPPPVSLKRWRVALSTSLSASLVALLLPLIGNAANVHLVATSPTVGVTAGEFVTFDVVMDFTADTNGLGSDRTLGGGFDIIFDPTHLAFVSLNDGALGDPAFRRNPDVESGRLESWGFADFNGLDGPATVGSVMFEVRPNGPLTSSVSTQPTNGVAGPFVSDVDFNTQLTVDFNSIEVVDAPEPGLVQLLLPGLLGLVALRGKGHRHARLD